MCKVMEEMREETRRKTRHETQREVVRGLLEIGKLTLEDISRSTKLPLDEVRRLAAETSQ